MFTDHLAGAIPPSALAHCDHERAAVVPPSDAATSATIGSAAIPQQVTCSYPTFESPRVDESGTACEKSQAMVDLPSAARSITGLPAVSPAPAATCRRSTRRKRKVHSDRKVARPVVTKPLKAHVLQPSVLGKPASHGTPGAFTDQDASNSASELENVLVSVETVVPTENAGCVAISTLVLAQVPWSEAESDRQAENLLADIVDIRDESSPSATVEVVDLIDLDEVDVIDLCSDSEGDDDGFSLQCVEIRSENPRQRAQQPQKRQYLMIDGEVVLDSHRHLGLPFQVCHDGQHHPSLDAACEHVPETWQSRKQQRRV
jgi:hypothetical protein